MRQTGRTANQMLSAPKGSLFIWCREDTSYPKHLAYYLGRSDLKIVSPGHLEGHSLRGLRVPAVIVDHATIFNDNQLEGFDYLNATQVR